MLSRDGVAGLVFLAGSATLLLMTRGLPQPALVPIGPGFYPRILLVVTVLLSLALVVADIVAQRRRGPVAPSAPLAHSAPVRYRLVVLTFVVFTAYVASMPWLGFRVATLAFVLALQAVLDTPRRARGWGLIVAVAVATTAVTYYAFEGYLHVLLPRGRLTGF